MTGSFSSYELVLSDKANADIDEASDYFDSERLGLGAQFVAEFVAVARLICVHPEMYAE